ncbi:MAG: tRNA (guanine(26)-N(2))-dimethyltransferase [Methanomassiliicoccales archaeon]
MIRDSIEIIEGKTKLLIPKEHSQKGPGKRLGQVFFNSQMAFNRDVTVMLFRALRFKGICLDAMAATGARGLRIVNESPGDFEMVLNDKDPRAFQYIQANISLNSLKNCQACNEDLRCHLAKHMYDYIDIDPFGSPVPFIHASFQGLKRGGILAITATDTATLSGTHEKKCIRRYMASPLRNLFCHETGLRIMLGYLAREAAQFDKGVRPILCFYADHYFRCFIRLNEGASAADAALENLGYVGFNESSHERLLSTRQAEGLCGPLWLGSLQDKELINSMKPAEDLAEPGRCAKYIHIWRQELNIPFFYENNEISSLLKTSPLPLEELLRRLNSVGRASRTHFSPTGFLTDLPIEKIKNLYLMSQI